MESIEDQIKNGTLLKECDIAYYFHLGPTTPALWRKRGHGPKFVKINGRIYYRIEDLRDWMEGPEKIGGKKPVSRITPEHRAELTKRAAGR